MAVYCVSDIHGHYKEFMELLDKVSPKESDKIYVLGDIIDRGQESAEMLKWAIDEANDNVKFLLGNHEDMSLACLMRDPLYMGIRMNEIWSINDGYSTTWQLKTKTDADWRRDKLLPWISNLPVYDVVNVNGQDWMLVHAGFYCKAFDSSSRDSFIDYNPDNNAHNETVDLTEYGFGIQYAQDMLWARYSWITYNKDTPLPVVYGHTYIKQDAVDYLKDIGIPAHGGDGKMFHSYNRVCIDCGASRDKNLGMLRLDDMEEFYLKN